MGLEKLKDITKYCDDNNLMGCIDGMENCPCRVIYREFPLCDFAKRYALWLIARQGDEADRLVESACPSRRNEVLQWRTIARFGQRNVREFFSRVKSGDRVYCTSKLSDVIYLERDVPPYGWVKYQTLDGEEQMQPPECFRNISKADYYAEYKVKGKNYEVRTEILKERARELGFRVEIIKLKEGLLLKIYGDSQEDVDDFVTLVCNNNFTLSLS